MHYLASAYVEGLCADVALVPVLGSSANYAYLLRDPASGKTLCVDPADPTTVMAEAKMLGWSMTTALTTHKHLDHAGGNEALLSAMGPGFESLGPAECPGLTRTVAGGEKIPFGNLVIEAVHTPCHTTGHLLYKVSGGSEKPILFTGDTLFVGGCGRFFEGTAEQMLSAADTIAAMPDDTALFCGHEYTVSNLKFAVSVDDSNRELFKVLERCEEARAANHPTVPSSVGQEKATNPFMRTRDAAVARGAGAAAGAAPAEVMKLLREKKDVFRS